VEEHAVSSNSMLARALSVAVLLLLLLLLLLWIGYGEWMTVQ
jgi:hypothetical protein